MADQIPVSKRRILVVDDAPFNATLLVKMLRDAGYQAIETASNGVEALKKTQVFSPHLVILDLVMPEMDGFEYCRRVRQLPAYAELPVLVQTSFTDSEQVSAAFEAGATDLISKPVRPVELIARSKVHIDRYLLLEGLTNYKKRLTNDLNIALAMQRDLLPSAEVCESISAQYGIQIGSRFEPHAELGGDFWGIEALSEHQVGFYIGDFSGHGVTAALNCFRLHSLLYHQQRQMLAPAAFLTSLNQSLHHLLDTEHFATMFLGIYDCSRQTLTYCGAGFPAAMLLRQDGSVDWLPSTHSPVGAMPGTRFTTQECRFSQGDTLCLYSDAMLESPTLPDGAFMREPELARLMMQQSQRFQEGKLQEAADGMLTEFRKRLQYPVQDDLTLLLLKNNARPSINATTSSSPTSRFPKWLNCDMSCQPDGRMPTAHGAEESPGSTEQGGG